MVRPYKIIRANPCNLWLKTKPSPLETAFHITDYITHLSSFGQPLVRAAPDNLPAIH